MKKSPTASALEKRGMAAAAWITASPHEWKWSQKEQEAMAATCMTLDKQLTIALIALDRIRHAESPDKLRKISEDQYGVEPEEAIEMAYENVIQEAEKTIALIKTFKKSYSPTLPHKA